MNTAYTRRAATALAAALVTLTAAPASAATGGAVTAKSVGAVAGYENVFQGEAATIEKFQIEGGDTVEALCIQFGVPMNDDSTYTAIPRSEAGVTDVGRAAWIGANHTKVGTPLADAHLEATATQLAAWSFTDGLTYSEETLKNKAARDRIAELVDAAGSIGEANATFTLDLDVERDGNAVVATATVTGDGDAPLADQSVTFNVDGAAEGEIEVSTDASGKAVVSAPAVEGEGVVTATLAGTLAPGAVLRPDDGGQLFVTTQAAAITRTEQASFAAAAAGDPVPDTDPEPKPEPTDEPEDEPAAPVADPATPTDTPDELPYTGPEDALAWLAVAGAIGAAGYGFHLRRKAS